MKIVRKVLLVTGIIGAILAAEGLNRMRSFVSAFGGEDAVFYNILLVIAVVAAVVLLLALFNKVYPVAKWITFVLLLIACGLMMAAPALPVLQQTVLGLIFGAIGCLVIKKESEDRILSFP